MLARILVGLIVAVIPARSWGADPRSLKESTTIVIHAVAEDAAAAALAGQTADVIARRASDRGVRSVADPRVADLIALPPEVLVRTAVSLETARGALADGIQQNTRLRLESAQESLFRARSAFLEAVAFPSYDELGKLHLYLGIVALNLREPTAASAHFRIASQLSPSRTLDPRAFSPSVVELFNDARRGAPARATLRVECEPAGALILVDGTPHGVAPRVLEDLSPGEHYLEVRAPGFVPILQLVRVSPGSVTPVPVELVKAPASFKQVWSEDGEGKADPAGAAIARILGHDRLALATVRSTVAGVSPFEVRGAVFDAASRAKIRTGAASASRDPATTEARLGRFAEALLAAAQERGESIAARVATSARFVPRDRLLVRLESGGAVQDRNFDGHARYQTGRAPPFREYQESRTVLRLRYGVRDRVTVTFDAPFYAKRLIDSAWEYQDSDGDGNPDTFVLLDERERDDAGMGDVVAGADIRVPRLQAGPLALAYVGFRAKLPTGNDATQSGSISDLDTLVMGSGQFDLQAGIGGVLARGRTRFGFEASYNARLPDRVAYYNTNRFRQHLNPGDEQKLHADGAVHLGGWFAPELFADFIHRNKTENFGPEMFLLDAGIALRAQFSERLEAGVAGQHPVWGKNTRTFFPLDVTGPRGWVYAGWRL